MEKTMKVTVELPDEWVYRAMEMMRTRGPEDTVRGSLRYVLGYEVFGWENQRQQRPDDNWEEGAAALEFMRREELNETMT